MVTRVYECSNQDCEYFDFPIQVQQSIKSPVKYTCPLCKSPMKTSYKINNSVSYIQKYGKFGL